MTADEAFQELGYMLIDTEDDLYDYHITCFDEISNNWYSQDIIFELIDKEIEILTSDDYPVMLNINELKAINQKCKELGWLEEK